MYNIGVSRKKRGFTLIEVLVDMFLLSVVFVTVFAGFMSTTKVIKLSRAKITAVALVNEKMEELRNMPYDSVATQHGMIYPPGNLVDMEEFQRGGYKFTLKRDIRYVDDPFDGDAAGTIAGKPKDLYPYDYKKVELSVSLVGGKGILATISSNMSGKAAETPSNTGIIKVCIVDSLSLSVSEANVKIQNFSVSPVVDINIVTGTDGCIFVPNLPPESHNKYHLEVTKSGYSTDMTYPRTVQNPNAQQPDVNVIIQEVTSQTLSIDRLGSLVVDIVDSAGAPVPSASLHIVGKKLKWFNPSTPKYSADVITDENGHLKLENMEFGDYTITVLNKTIAMTSPYQPVSLKAASEISVKIQLAASGSSLIIKSCEPLNGLISTTVNIDIIGQNISSGATIKLVRAAVPDIIGTNVTLVKGVLSADFNLANAQVGLYDIVITNSGGESLTQIGGFEVLQK